MYKPIQCADKKFLYAYWEGTVILIKDPTKPIAVDNIIIDKNALLVEGIAKSLISVPSLDQEYSFTMENGHCIIKSPPDKANSNKRHIIYKIQKASNTDNLYHLPFYTVSEIQGEHNEQINANNASVEPITMDLAHQIMNHAHVDVCVKIWPHLKGQKQSFCEACALAGLKNKPFSKSDKTKSLKEKTKSYLPAKETAPNAIFSNLTVNVEPRSHKKEGALPLSDFAADGFTSPVVSVRNIKYVFVMVDTITRMCYPFLTSTKDEFKPEYMKWAKNIYNRTGRFPAYIRVDGAGELTSGDMKKFFGDCGTIPTSSTTKQSNQNAYAERLIGVLWRKTKIILTHCGLPMSHWCYAFAYVAIVYNHTPHRGVNFQRPIDLAGITPVDWLLKPFGCECYYYLPAADKSLLTGHRGVFLGFDNFKRGHLFLNLTTRKIESSRTAIFRVKSFPFVIANKGIL